MSARNPSLEELVKESEVKKDLKEYLERRETGDAELFALMFRDRVVYDHSAKAWLIRRVHWEDDRNAKIRLLVSNQLAAEYLRAGAERAEKGGERANEAAEPFIKRARLLMQRRYQDNMLVMAQSQPDLSLTGDEWDRYPMLLGVKNGVIDLTTGEFRDGTPREYLKAHSPVEWLGINQPAPIWEKSLQDTFNNDLGLVSFMQRWWGYCLTGNVNEHVLPILYGPDARNGKTTLAETVAGVMGDSLASRTETDLLMNVKQDGKAAQPFVHGLRGKRYVWASESREGQQINTSQVKQLTGADRITARALFGNPVTFTPTHKIMLMTNHKPHISADDQGMWDRLLLIPFEVRFVDDPKAPNERKRIPGLKETLLENEASGILAWLVRGCLAWQAQGLCPPAKVKAATQVYREAEDVVGEFVADCLISDPGKQAGALEIFERYEKWAKENGAEQLTQKTFRQRLIRRFGEPKRTKKGYFYKGISFLVHGA